MGLQGLKFRVLQTLPLWSTAPDFSLCLAGRLELNGL